MILSNGMIKITDFGVATALNSTQLTQTNSVMGTVHCYHQNRQMEKDLQLEVTFIQWE